MTALKLYGTFSKHATVLLAQWLFLVFTICHFHRLGKILNNRKLLNRFLWPLSEHTYHECCEDIAKTVRYRFKKPRKQLGPQFLQGVQSIKKVFTEYECAHDEAEADPIGSEDFHVIGRECAHLSNIDSGMVLITRWGVHETRMGPHWGALFHVRAKKQHPHSNQGHREGAEKGHCRVPERVLQKNIVGENWPSRT